MLTVLFLGWFWCMHGIMHLLGFCWKVLLWTNSRLFPEGTECFAKILRHMPEFMIIFTLRMEGPLNLGKSNIYHRFSWAAWSCFIMQSSMLTDISKINLIRWWHRTSVTGFVWPVLFSQELFCFTYFYELSGASVILSNQTEEKFTSSP